MRIAILYICTGRYSIFWPEFFASCEQFFLPEAEKHYYVFTDQSIQSFSSDRVNLIEQPQLCWPDITLKRLHILSAVEKQLTNYDYVFFFNANSLFCKPVGVEFLPETDDSLIVVQHPGFYNKRPVRFPYERNPNSCAYIPKGQGKHYVCGGINGGTSKVFIAMMHHIRNAVDMDLKTGIIARWHDESHLNRYILQVPYKLLHPGYATPDERNLPFPTITRLINKRSTGGHTFMRGGNPKTVKTLKERFFFRPSFPKPTENKPLVLARLLGGLGNQMFIYATAYALARRIGAQLELDTGALQSDVIRRYELHNFGIFTPQWRVPKGVHFLLSRWLRLQSFCCSAPHWSFLYSPPSYIPLPKSVDNYYLQGYWQSPYYYSDYTEEIRKQFIAPITQNETTAALQAYIQSAPTAFVHLRRSDYTKPKVIKKHGILPLYYYEQARKLLEKKCGSIQYLVFSDEPDMAEQLFSHWKHTQFVPIQSAIDDIMLMRQCQHSIIANSSFSWWGAWLGETAGQTVVAPRQWFAPNAAEPFSVQDLFPSHWNVL